MTDPNALERTKTAVAAVLPPGLRVEEPVLRKEVIRKTVAGFQTTIAAFSLLAVLAGFVICYSRLSAIFESRTWEIGLLRAVGLRRIVVFVELLKESLLLGSAGTAIGIPLGIAIARYGLPIAARTSAIVFRLPVAAAVVTARWDVVILGAGVGLLAAFLSASAPALRLARTEPVAALTMRGRDTQAAAPRFSTSLALGLFMLSGAVAVLQHLSLLRALGLVTTGLVAFGVCASAATIVRYGGRVLAPLWRYVFGPTGEFAAGHLVEHPRRISLTVASLGVGLGAVLMFGMLAWSFERTLVSRLTASFRAPLIVSSAHLGVGYRSAPISDHLVDELAALPGVRAVGGEQSTDVEFADGVVVLKSYDATCFRDPMVHEFPLDSGALPDALGLVGRGQAVFVSSAFAYQHGTRPGDTIHFRSPNGPLAFTVAAVASQPENAITLVRDQYAKFWNDSHVYLAHVALNPAADPSAVRTIIAKTLGTKYRVQVRSTAALVDYFAEQVRQGFSILYPLEAIAFVLLLVGVGDTLSTGVLERTKEFAMMRAVGLQQSRLLLIVMLEGVGIGVLGLILALAAGVVLGLFWTAVQFPAMMGFRLDPHFPSSFALTAAALTIFICLAGSLLPSLRAARLSVVEGLRNE